MWRLRSDLRTGDIFGHVILWFMLLIVTCGFAGFLFPYSLGATVINSTTLVNEHGHAIGRLRCTRTVGHHFLHALWWWFLTLITLGIAGIFYVYRVSSDLMDATVVERVA